MIKKRDDFADALKSYACILVVIYHIIIGINRAGFTNVSVLSLFTESLCSSIHVYLFMFISGYIYIVTSEWKSKKTRGRFILHKLLNLGVPYVFFSVMYVLINKLLSSSVNNEFQLSAALYMWISPIAHYWYLYALFFVFLLFVILSKWLNYYQITISMVIIYSIGQLFSISFISPLHYAITMGVYFGLGCCISNLYFWGKKKNIGYIILGVYLLFSLIIFLFHYEEIWYIKTIWRILGIYSSIFFINCICQIHKIDKSLKILSRYSFPIYLLHPICTAGIRIILLKMNITNYIVHFSFGLIFGIGGPMLIGFISNKVAIFDFFLYPDKVLKRYITHSAEHKAK